MSGGPPHAECRVCGASGRARRLRQFATRGAERVALCRCGACGCEYLDPQPSPAWLEANYAGYFARRRATLSHPKLAFFTDLLRSSGLDLSGRRVLEIGAAEGDGVLALHALWPDAHITALDGHPESLPYSRELPCRFVSETVEAWLGRPDRERFDVCLMLDVLEHLREPAAVLRQLARDRLAPGAVLMATFPNADGCSRRLLGPFWPHYNAEHLYYFSREGVAALGRRCGLRTRRLEPLPKRLPLGYILDVACYFGPPATRRLARLLRRLVPRAAHELRLRVVLGEWLWVADLAGPLPPEGRRSALRQI